MHETEKKYDQAYYSLLIEKYGKICNYLLEKLSKPYATDFEPYIAFNLNYNDSKRRLWMLNINLMDGTLDVTGNHGAMSGFLEKNFKVFALDTPVTQSILQKFKANRVTMNEKDMELFRMATQNQDAVGMDFNNGITLIEHFADLGIDVTYEQFVQDFEKGLAFELQDR